MSGNARDYLSIHNTFDNTEWGVLEVLEQRASPLGDHEEEGVEMFTLRGLRVRDAQRKGEKVQHGLEIKRQ